MRIAAIDIGSNAIRFRVVDVFETKSGAVFRSLENVRFPLRLGTEVFTNSFISPETEDKFIKLIQAYRVLIDLYEVEHYLAYATSAMREAENGEALAKKCGKICDMDITLIDGKKESAVLSMAIEEFLGESCYIHVDVGGGSTEINLYKNKANVDSRSFTIGAVRGLGKGLDKETLFNEMGEWISSTLGECVQVPVAIGTGGNINALMEHSGNDNLKFLSLEDLISTRDKINQLDVLQRVRVLNMPKDRADVIVPGADIYIKAMQKAGAESIIAPGTGLIDGIIREAYIQHTEQGV
ncbi:phosphatase [Flammeovirgaceae bacterium SG7u.111]|nr:phosphatase [Flammeovirgaceae bacterium SG7u.132]WPO34017.1 phosphatase [Flammeovirgaceae bacterium SG7u.111]